MSWIIRLYPHGWRERYGDELSLILEERPPTLTDTIDLMLGALDAHVHRRTFDGRPAAASAAPLSVRIGAWAAVAGGLVWIATIVLAVTRGTRSDGLAIVLLSLASLLFLVALAGLSAGPSRAHPMILWASLLLPAVGLVSVGVGVVAQAMVGDRPIVDDLTPYAFWIVGTLLALVGCALLGAVSAATGALTGRAAVTLAGGAAVQLATILGTDHARDGWLILAGAAAFGLSWILVGVAGTRARGGPIGVTDQPA